MTYTLMVFIYRNPTISPAAFQSHYESAHIPLLQSFAGPYWPISHTRRYVERSSTTKSSSGIPANDHNTKLPAKVLAGTQADFDYDATAELIFEDEAAFGAFFASVSKDEVVEDEKKFLDRDKMRAVAMGDAHITSRASRGS